MTVVASDPQAPLRTDTDRRHRSEEHRHARRGQERCGGERDSFEDLGVDELFGRLARSTDCVERQRWRQRIVTACVPIADRIASRFMGRGEPSEDLLQVARMGLIHSVDRYQAGRGHFLAFAVPTIRGELRRHFRDKTWTVRVPRRVQETQLRIREAVSTLSQRLNRSPTTIELAEELGVDTEAVCESEAVASAYQPVSLDAPVAYTQSETTEAVGSLQGSDDPGYEQVEDMLMIKEALAALEPRRRAVVGMIFFDCLTQREVADKLNVSQVQVSRLLNDTLSRIRQRVCVEAPAALRVSGRK
ncbi:SigB/SigF/SigG family RNA polymerase sigma factor [Mycobacterium neumannii]|uniref:SigB/SigF/SigG family RNA polymerase sigma factor n=1 Tax=Mycobacterium neumannii TaxID=2048551 RepID=UPI003AB194CA